MAAAHRLDVTDGVKRVTDSELNRWRDLVAHVPVGGWASSRVVPSAVVFVHEQPSPGGSRVVAETQGPDWAKNVKLIAEAPRIIRRMLDEIEALRTEQSRPPGAVPGELRDALIAAIPAPRVPSHVAEWPEDERELYRSGGWTSFPERDEMLDRLRREKVADAVFELLNGPAPAPAGAAEAQGRLADYRLVPGDVGWVEASVAEMLGDIARQLRRATVTAHMGGAGVAAVVELAKPALLFQQISDALARGRLTIDYADGE